MGFEYVMLWCVWAYYSSAFLWSACSTILCSSVMYTTTGKGWHRTKTKFPYYPIVKKKSQSSQKYKAPIHSNSSTKENERQKKTLLTSCNCNRCPMSKCPISGIDYIDNRYASICECRKNNDKAASKQSVCQSNLRIKDYCGHCLKMLNG